jgi:peptidoglycan hydrolase-like protein with peptidoglycan-binding domain
MEYCNQCGELVEGRFCRMCGAPTAVAAAQAAVPAASATAGYPDGYGHGYGAPVAYAPVGAETRYHAAGAPYEPEGPQAGPATPAEFDGFFRTEDGSPSPHAHTQLLAPVQADYRMDPPGGSRVPPQAPVYDEDEDAEEARRRRLLMYGTLGAVLLAAALILGMLLLGGNNDPVTTAGAAATTGTGQSPTPSATGNAGTVVVPTASAGTVTSKSAAPSTSAAESFSGDTLPLGPGSHGTNVTYVQRRLQLLGYYHGKVSGTFDQATALAVQQFQAAAQVTGDAASTVGRHTMVALIAAGDTPNLRTGGKSADVSRLDQALNEALGTHIQVSNRYTATTTEEVMRYQSAVGLPPTGQVDAATWAKLQSGAL